MFYCGHVDDKHEPVWHLKPPITNYVHGVGFASQCSAHHGLTLKKKREWQSSSLDGDRTRQTATAGTTTGTTAGTTAAGS